MEDKIEDQNIRLQQDKELRIIDTQTSLPASLRDKFKLWQPRTFLLLMILFTEIAFLGYYFYNKRIRKAREEPGVSPSPTPLVSPSIIPTITPIITPTPSPKPILKPSPSPGPSVAGIELKVFLLIFNPVIESRGGRKLTEIVNWNNPDQLAQTYIQDLKEASGGFVNYRIEERKEMDDIPQKLDGFDYTDETYLECWYDHSTCHQPDMVDYGKIFQDYDICNKDVSEVWLFGGPWFGGYEWIVKGPELDLYSVNAPNCGRTITTFVFNYERTVHEMLEDFGHKTETLLTRTGIISRDLWDKFDGQYHRYSYQYGNPCPWMPPLEIENAHCGNVHFAPNSLCHYEWNSMTKVGSDCDDWYNYPYLTGTKKEIDCREWGCEKSSEINHHKWWLQHLPRAAGKKDGKLNNWWWYVVDYDQAIKE